MLIVPSGLVLPCHSAAINSELPFDNGRKHDLQWILQFSLALNRFRGYAWMSKTCKSCERKNKDFSSFRCEAFMLPGDAEAGFWLTILMPAWTPPLRRTGRASTASRSFR
jgi:pyrroloquinoline quinone biosynthesis protein E